MEPFEYTPSMKDQDADYLDHVREIETELYSDGFEWDNEFTSKVMNTIEKMRTEINFFRSSNGFKNSTLEYNSESSMKESANSFYSMPVQIDEQLLIENDELRSQILELESNIHETPEFDNFFNLKTKFESPRDNDSVHSMPVNLCSDHKCFGCPNASFKVERDRELHNLKSQIREKQDKLNKLRKEMGDMKSTSNGGAFNINGVYELKKKLETIERQLKEEENDEILKQQEQDLEEIK